MSDKFNIIDHVTFEKMQQSSSSMCTKLTKIRNSKYKRMAATNHFNILQFVIPKQQGKNFIKKRKIRRRIVDTPVLLIKNKGKKRENGARKKPTRLKKSILQYRQKKRQQQSFENLLEKSERDLRGLRIDDTKNNNRIGAGIHSSNFREYCNCCKSSDLKKYCEQLLRELNHFQRRAYAQNEIKARAHKRFVVGFRQVQSYLSINKIKLVVIATDCERNAGDGNVSLDETIESIKNLCNDQNIPVVFAFRRREMAYFIYKKASISCIGILDYDGAREIFAQVMEALKTAREMYKNLFKN